MNTRDELLEVMARAANQDKWYWHSDYDAPRDPELADYDLAMYFRAIDVRNQNRALAAIETKGARVVPIEATDEMSQAGGEAQCIVNCNGHYSQPDVIYEAVIAASPFAPEKKR